MKIDWQNDENAPNGYVINVDTGERVTGPDGACCFVDEEAGVFRRYAARNGKYLVGVDGKLLVEQGRAKVKFVPHDKISEEATT